MKRLTFLYDLVWPLFEEKLVYVILLSVHNDLIFFSISEINIEHKLCFLKKIVCA